MLEGKARLLREKALTKKPNKTNSLTRQEEGILWESGQLVKKNPKSIYSLVTARSTFWVARETRTPLHESWRFVFSKIWNWSILHSLQRGNNKNKKKWPTSKKSATVTKNVWNTIWKVSCKTLSKVSFKTPSWDGKFRTVLFATYCKSFKIHLHKKTSTGINSINSMMKDLISNSPLQNSEKHLANHSARKTLAKNLKQHQVPKSEIISITGYNH